MNNVLTWTFRSIDKCYYAEYAFHCFSIYEYGSLDYQVYFKKAWETKYNKIGAFEGLDNAKLFADAYIDRFMRNNSFYYSKSTNAYSVNFNNNTSITGLEEKQAISLVHHLNYPKDIWKKVK